MKLTNNRYYFDFNATSPLSESVLDWLRKGDLPFGNPSSIHSTGKAAKREITAVKNYLLEDLFFVADTHKLFFHSGASEAINTFLTGSCHTGLKEKKSLHVFISSVDHSAAYNQKEEVEALGMNFTILPVSEDGMPLIDQWTYEIEKSKADYKILNFTWVNNETGVVWPLEQVLELKKKTGVFVHVDSVQSVGKIEDWSKLEDKLDAYTFSGHKFGSLKGIGFSFVKENFPFEAMIRGGGQQDGYRSGTENVPGILSLKLALEDLSKRFDAKKVYEGITYLREKIYDLGESSLLFPSRSSLQNLTTINFVVPGTKADILMTAFDLAKMDVSSGSACSSGAVLPSRVLMSMGVSEEDAKSALRFSFSPYLTLSEAEEFWAKIEKVLSRFL